jgi:hypothetical protein
MQDHTNTISTTSMNAAAMEERDSRGISSAAGNAPTVTR